MPALLVLATGCGEQLDRWAARGVAAACMATWGMQRCYKSMMNGDWRRTWADKAEASIMAWTGVRVCGLAVGVWGCPLTPGTTQGSIGAAHRPLKKLRGGIRVPPDQGPTQGAIGAAHGPREKICGGMGVSPDPRTNSGRYRGRPRV